MNLELARSNMIEQQIRTWNVFDPQVLALFSMIKRENFVPEAYRNVAFMDMAIPLSIHGQTTGQIILSPKVEARLLQALTIKKNMRVLEIGAGSGHFAALLAHFAAHVITIEQRPELFDFARENLQKNHIRNVELILGDGTLGCPESAPFDVIIISAAVEAIPTIFYEQLAPEGQILAFVGEPPLMEAQLITHQGAGQYVTKNLFETEVPPLVLPHHSQFKF